MKGRMIESVCCLKGFVVERFCVVRRMDGTRQLADDNLKRGADGNDAGRNGLNLCRNGWMVCFLRKTLNLGR